MNCETTVDKEAESQESVIEQLEVNQPFYYKIRDPRSSRLQVGMHKLAAATCDGSRVLHITHGTTSGSPRTSSAVFGYRVLCQLTFTLATIDDL